MNNLDPTIVVAGITVLGGILGKVVDSYLRKRTNTQGSFLSLPLIVGLLLGFVGGLSLGRISGAQRQPPQPPDTVLWDFNQGPGSWDYKDEDPQDASQGVTGKEQALLADFDFGQSDPDQFDGNKQPRATFLIDNLRSMQWTDYDLLILDIKNETIPSLEIYFSVKVNDCFYESTDWTNLPAQTEWQTITFPLTTKSFKACDENELAFLPRLDAVQRFDIIIGTNAPEAEWDNVDGEILIDNIRLRKVPVQSSQ
jgi:hypothetical protein